MPQFSLDLSTLAVAVIAGLWTYMTWKSTKKAEKQAKKVEEQEALRREERRDERQETQKLRQMRRDDLDFRDYVNRDLAEAHAIHSELTCLSTISALQNADVEPHKSFLRELHRRLSTRTEALYDDTGLPQTRPESFDAFGKMIDERLTDLKRVIDGPSARQEATEKPSRDFTKYFWGDSPQKYGKGAILSFIGARFVKQHAITSVDGFTQQFGSIVHRIVSAETEGVQFDKTQVASPLFYDGQRDRYATENRRWRDTHGSEGVMTLDGVEYRTSWSLGCRGATVAPLQRKLIEYFATEENYPIVEIGSA